ncbi:MAG: threonine synthase [Bdellovibrionales bacterium GWA2_49_15]|nr:MAG: threonine synthase [Bdellovibrionales bacterium GWA2_49_15]HAZ14790.1 threonine synthase [Bdellovibrionales bacterium]
MKYLSTRTDPLRYSLSDVLKRGICPSGGLFVSESLPKLSANLFELSDSYQSFSEKLLRPFFTEDTLEKHLSSIVTHALNFPVPWKEIGKNHYLLELFHGPTAAFKDVGARFLAACFEKLGEQKTILVATSGDTGGAVASAFYEKNGIKVVILFPKLGVSPLQRHQLTCWGKNILSLEVAGDFDDCQRMVKEAFSDKEACAKYALTSANSINIGRLLPQMTYYAFCSYQLFSQLKRPVNFVIPSGNMGNGMAAVWAKEMGMPIGEIHFACNSNRAIFDYFQSKKLTVRKSLKTLANAMDVGNPSNMERLLDLLSKNPAIAKDLTSSWHSDEKIRSVISDFFLRTKGHVCPHTAVALAAHDRFSPESLVVSVATAHPYKFQEIIQDILGPENLPAPPALTALLKRPAAFNAIGKHLTHLQAELLKFC